MAKVSWKPGNMVYPLPAVMATVRGKDGKDNIITIAWTGTVCSDPAMLYISVRKERHSYQMIKDSGEFVVNLTTDRLVKQTDYCGVKSGRDVDKFKETGLTRGKANELQYAPIIEESPVNIECKLEKIEELGSHHMFIARVVSVQVDEAYMNETGKFCLNETGLIAYSHGEYRTLGQPLGTFGYSIKKKKKK
jgi:flavin reductase (DIM6/NTAB) family NADH-FMN oxidoreductase RutF